MGYLTEKFETMKSDSGKTVVKHPIYGPYYEKHLEPFRDKPIILVEIGTGHGGCLQVWKDYLGSKAMIYGIDHKGELFYEEPRIKHYLADQHDKISLEAIPIQNIDIFIDDASHESPATITTFEVFFPRMISGGLYIVEDVGTAYRVVDYCGGYRKPGSFIEYCKDMVDWLQRNEWAELIPPTEALQKATAHLIPNNPLFSSIKSVTFYMGMIIIEKA